MNSSLESVVTAIDLSDRTMRNIHQNLGFALGYNGLGIPVAAGVLYPLWHVLLSPMIAGAVRCAQRKQTARLRAEPC